MNCQSAQQLISPYLDQQLTGVEMLTMREHLDSCPSCAEEYRQMRDVRLMLRSLSSVVPDKPLGNQITLRVVQPPPKIWHFGTSASGQSLANDPSHRPRGRRLAGALAMACTALLIMAAPFAPSTGDSSRAARLISSDVAEADLSQGAVPMSSPFVRMGGGAGFRHPLFGSPAEMQAAWGGAHEFSQPSPQAGATVTLSDWSAEPLDDEAVGGYAAGDAALTNTHGH